MTISLVSRRRAGRHVACLFVGLAALSAAASTRAEGPASAAVLDRPVAKGQLLIAADFIVGPVSESQARSALRPRDAAGMEAARNLAAGQIVRSADLMRPQIVRRGEQVLIFVRGATMQITSPGRALSNAAAGEPVRVVSTATNRTLDAVADAPGSVYVPF